ncbi:non-homologous end-joining DNA ligase [Alkaliphilus hydrothermalis]|uniref:Bifunctional non-homologous end joining protein LigD n=1 Tax=Alkaliphilus hydrothermalis TaxID=1482730 RepID=A0ABS2NSB6_9FIRM|nr:non-homologous end-joining DNA ligase [Alkaliphilus hydrothermalis]MBM7615726.1 bifunctional non-homologous end joining protein LigD [Alkaliphilus hydrothermalis]
MAKQKERHQIIIEGHTVDITHPTKVLWPKKNITKLQYLQYLIEISPYLLPFLSDRHLTVIRYPNGVHQEPFYQKSCPSYAPGFVETDLHEDIDYILCNNLPTLVWLGNQGAIDLHVPFNTNLSQYPSEIVMDLDPPSRKEFNLAVEGVLMMKEIFDKLDLISFVKTSGNKGIQVYIPLPEDTYTYDDTRIFTEFIANYLTSKEPKWFTTERMKKKRDNRLYVDYLQHAAGKTIICPYSLRGNDEALVATPLFWEELNSTLKPTQFPMESILERVGSKGNPFEDFEAIKGDQDFSRVMEIVKNLPLNPTKGL